MNIHFCPTHPNQFEFNLCEKFPSHGIIAEVPQESAPKETPLTPDEIFAKWEPLAYRFTAGWNIPGYAPEDLQQEARMAIFRVAGKFDPTRGCFFTVAKRAIHNQLSSLATRGRTQKRTASVQSLDAPITEGGDSLYNLVEDRTVLDAGLPDGVALREAIEAHLEKIRTRSYRTPAEAKRQIDEALEKVSEVYGLDLKQFKPKRRLLKKKMATT